MLNMSQDLMRDRNRKRDNLGKCSECGLHKCPPGTFSNICPDCGLQIKIEEALAKIRNKNSG